MDIRRATGRDIERYIRRTALREGYVVIEQHGEFDPDIESAVDDFGCHGFVQQTKDDSFMYLFFRPNFDPELVYWMYQHERGHVYQKREWGWGLYVYRHDKFRFAVELDAWKVAQRIARDEDGITMSDRAINYAYEALESYAYLLES